MTAKLKFSAFAASLLMAIFLSSAPPLFVFIAFVGLPIAMMITALTSPRTDTQIDVSANQTLKWQLEMWMYCVLTCVVIFVAVCLLPAWVVSYVVDSNVRALLTIVGIMVALRLLILALPFLLSLARRSHATMR